MKTARLHSSLLLILIVLASTPGETKTLGETAGGLISVGDRSGLFLRLDFGPGLSLISAEKDSWARPKWDTTVFGVSTMTSLGLGVTDKLLLHVSVRYNLYGELGLLSAIVGPLGMVFSDDHTVVGVGATYYFRSEAPSLFAELGIAGGNIDNPFDNKTLMTTGHEGLGFFTGVGYEFVRHLQAELGMHWTRNEKPDQERRGKWTATTFTLTLGFILY